MDSQEPAAKQQKIETSVNLTVQLTSGTTLTTIEASESWLVGDVLKGLPVEAGTHVQSVLFEGDVLDAKKTLAECGISESAVLTAVVVGVPTLHLFKPCSSQELGGSGSDNMGRRDYWTVGGAFYDTPITLPGVQHRRMEDAPQAAQEVARALQTASPGLDDIQCICRSSESNDGGEVVVIANPGADAKDACFKALAICTQVEGGGRVFGPLADQVEMEEKDWTGFVDKGFNDGSDSEVPEDDTKERAGLVALTRVMADKLTQCFIFTFSDEVAVAPMLYGGFASDGSIVGILTSRVWT